MMDIIKTAKLDIKFKKALMGFGSLGEMFSFVNMYDKEDLTKEEAIEYLDKVNTVEDLIRNRKHFTTIINSND